MLLVHLSDIHFREEHFGSGMDPYVHIRNELVRDITDECARLDKSAEVILISGDVASASHREQYTFAVDTTQETASGTTIGVLDLTSKANTDDMRDSPALDLMPALIVAGATVQAYDSGGLHEAAKVLGGVAFAEGLDEAAAGADALVIVTERDQFRALDLDRVKRGVAKPVLKDLRNVYRADEMRARGFAYSSIGRA